MKWSILLFTSLSFLSCLSFGTQYEAIPPGIWRGVLYLGDETDGFDEETNAELPFNFEVIYDSQDSFHIVIHNADERIVVREIRRGRNVRTARDTFFIDFPVYDSHISADYEEDALEGWWVVRNRKDYKIKFKAKHGENYRFMKLPEPPAADISGVWECHFGVESETPDTSVGYFSQKGNHLTGTFVSPTGDDRFLEGTVSGDRMFLSVFDGTHAYLYEAKITDDGQLTGIYRSGNHFKTYWQAQRNDTLNLLDLADPLSMTNVKSKGEPFTINFSTPEGIVPDLDQPPFAGKPKIIQIMGTWCPNCRDETEFLLDYLSKNPNTNFEILGIAFERHTDPEKARTAIKTYREKMQIPYLIVYGGSNNKASASEALPMLNEVVAYPTLLFLNEKNEIVATHTGFSGPATPGYRAFQETFQELVNKITSE